MKSARKYIIIGFLCLGVSGAPFLRAQEVPVDLLSELKLFSRALGAIIEGYVGDIRPREMFYEAVRGMTRALDPYSEFVDPETFELMKISIEGEYAGIGTWIQEVDGFIIIENIRPGTAADLAGLAIGDRILAVDQVLTKNMTAAEVGRMLRGEAGEEVHLTLLREEEELEVSLTRERIEIEAIRDARIVGRAIGYIQIVDFQEHTVEQFDKAVRELLEGGAEALVIDLRNNSGGLLNKAVELSERFLPPGRGIVFVQSKVEAQRKEHYAEWDGEVYELPLVILVNQRSASASEVFSAAMQDHGRGLVIGTQTFGKASVQSVIPLDESAAMKLTTARYIRPNGQMIDGKGIEPDIIIEDGTTNDPEAQNQIRVALEVLQDFY